MYRMISKITNWIKKQFNVLILLSKTTKVERLIYYVMFLWVVFGILGIKYESNLTYIAAYYASLSIFIGSYIWGEYKRSSSATKLFEKGPNSVREVTIYLTLILWLCLGIYGVINNADFSKLTVYFAALAPFVNSFIIYETSRKDKKQRTIKEDERTTNLINDIIEKGKES